MIEGTITRWLQKLPSVRMDSYLEFTIYLWVVLFLRLNYVLCSVSTFTVRISSYIDTLKYKSIYIYIYEKKENACLKKTQTKKLLNCVLLCNRLYSSGLCLPYPGHMFNVRWPGRRSLNNKVQA